MAFETSYSAPPSQRRPRVAIIGAGVSGLGAAWRLAPHCDVTIFEADNRAGGHARTIMAGPNRDIPVDTGFMVFNHRTYPNLVQLFEQLDIPSIHAPMSFAVSMDDGKFEYGLTNLARVFADRRNIFSPRFMRMLRDILKFNAHASNAATLDMTIADLIDAMELGEDFADRYLYPLAGAIWSTAREDMKRFPAETFIRFFENHGLMSAHDGPKWRTIPGGSQRYVAALLDHLTTSGVVVRYNAKVQGVGRRPTPWVRIGGCAPQNFDKIILACHSDQALRLLSDPSREERAILGAIRYRSNAAYLHCDPSHMPARRAAWSAWVYKGLSGGEEKVGSFTYWMNALQSIPEATPLFVTLNPERRIDEAFIYDAATFDHPQFDMAAINAQARLPAVQGVSNTWYCGAWTRYGFHEDGLDSGINAANGLMSAVSAGSASTS